MLASTLNNLGNHLLEHGDEHGAATLLDESVALRRALGDGVGLPISLHNRGEAARQQGDLDGATRFLAESLTLRWASGDRRGIARCLESLAAVALAQSNAIRAARLLGASDALRATMGVPMWPVERDEVEETMRGVRKALGPAAVAAWTTGHALTAEQAVAEALESTAESRIPR